MSTIAKRFFGPALVTNALATMMTVPSNERYIVRHIHVQNPSASAVTLTISVNADSAATRYLDAFSIPAAAAGVTESVKDFFVYIPLEAAEYMRVIAGTTNILTITVSGERIVLA